MKLRIWAMLFWVSLAAPAVADTVEQGIIVTGEGRVFLAPDMATVTLGVTERAKTAAQAMQSNADAVTGIIERLDAAGVDPWNRQTSRFYLRPLRSDRISSGTAPEFDGYEAGNMITVKVIDLDRLGETLDAVLAAGANDFNGIQFGLQDDSDAKSKARALAVADAMARASELARAAGLNMGGVIRMTEQSYGASPQPMQMARSESGLQNAVSQGEVEVSAQVTMVFAILP